MENKDLLTRLGGKPALKAAVEEFYDRLSKDERLEKFFEGVNMTALKAHQFQFMQIAFTKIPDDLNVPDVMAKAHKRLFEKGLNETHFDMVAGHLIGALQHLGVPQPLIDEAIGVVAPLRPVFEDNAISELR
mmetsp:Transcript_1537/g.1963  ORF Transcript_1537/g.1963 Transcript_1537/m.1963 type:complete len:132 (+) Transcript_1537:58-453(+)